MTNGDAPAGVQDSYWHKALAYAAKFGVKAVSIASLVAIGIPTVAARTIVYVLQPTPAYMADRGFGPSGAAAAWRA